MVELERPVMKRPKLGQHFLVDKNIARKIVDSASLTKKDTVIEIGPGKGVLTELILPKVKKLICIEIDGTLVAYLKRKFAGYRNLKIIPADFLSWKPPKTILKKSVPIKFISNLPYYITTPIIKKIFNYKNWSTAVLTVQKEVGERMLAEPDTKNYGALTLFVKYFCNAEKVAGITSKCFYPEPKVDSIILKLGRIKTRGSRKFYESFSRIVNSAFKYRRKTLVNSLNRALGLDKTLIRGVLSGSGIDPSLRAENISFEKYINLTSSFKNYLLS